jgi:hypothetical protein
MKNKLSDLNNHLFAQLERLGDEDLTADQIDNEVARAKAIVGVAAQIVSAQNLNLRAVELIAEYGERFHDKLTMIEAPR